MVDDVVLGPVSRSDPVGFPVALLGQVGVAGPDPQVLDDAIVRVDPEIAARERDPRRRGRLSREVEFIVDHRQALLLEIDHTAGLEDDQTRPVDPDRGRQLASRRLGDLDDGRVVVQPRRRIREPVGEVDV